MIRLFSHRILVVGKMTVYPAIPSLILSLTEKTEVTMELKSRSIVLMTQQWWNVNNIRKYDYGLKKIYQKEILIALAKFVPAAAVIRIEQAFRIWTR